MLRQSLVLVTAPASEPVTLAEAKAWARIEGEADDVVNGLITAARQLAEEYLGRSLITQTWKLTLDLERSGLNDLPEGVYDLPSCALYSGLPKSIPLPRGPVASINSVVTFGTDNASSTFAPSNYRVDASGDRLLLNYGSSWPTNIRPQSGCEITYVAGYGDEATKVPQPIRRAITSIIAGLLADMDLAGNIKTMKAGDGLITRFDTGALDRTAMALLAPYRKVRL